MRHGFGEKLSKLRTELNLSQKQFGERIGTTQTNIALYESGERLPSCDNLVAIARTFHVSTDYLLGIEPKRSMDLSDLYEDDVQIMEIMADVLRKRSMPKNETQLHQRYTERLRMLRKERHLTQSEVAALLHVKQRNYSAIESGKTRLTVENLRILAKYYDVTTDYLSGTTSLRSRYPQH